MTNGPAKEEIHWHVTAAPAPQTQVLDGTHPCDVLVVGAGLTGSRCAAALAEAGASVALVDARQIGWGASGRSGGQCNPIWRKSPQELVQLLGRRAGDNLVQATLTAADDLFADIKRFGIDCDARQAGWIQAAHTDKAARQMSALGAAWAEAGADISTLEGQALQRASGSAAYRFALRHAKGGHVHPLSLTRGYARAAIAKGAAVFEGTPITGLTRRDGRWHARTSGAEISAENVVLTTNAYTDDLWPGLKKTFVPLVSIILATDPLSAAQQQEVLPGQVTISDSRLAIFYARYDRDARLVFGCVGSDDQVDTLGGFGRLRAGLGTVFAQLKGIGIARKWAGRIAVTPQMMPHLHEPAPGVLAGLGFSGRGIAMTSVMGRTLAAKLLGTAPADLAFPVEPIRPMPLNGLSRRLVPLIAPSMTVRDRLAEMIDRARPPAPPEPWPRR